MFSTKLPRVSISVLASLVLLFVLFNTKSYLYNEEPYHPSSNTRTGPIAHLDLGSAEKPEVVLAEAAKPDGAVTVTTAQAAGSPSPELVSGQTELPALDDLEGGVETDLEDGPEADPKDELEDDRETDPDQPEGPGDPAQLSQGGEDPPPLQPAQCADELDLLRSSHSEHLFTRKVRYMRRCIQPVFSSRVDRDAVANISEPLIANAVTVDMEDCADVTVPACVPIRLEVPHPYPHAQFPHLIFGIATDLDRLRDSVGSFAHWLPGSESKLVALLTDWSSRTTHDIEELKRQFQHAGVDVELVRPVNESYTTSQSHFTVLLHMLNHRTAATQWYGLLDDDTFFPSLQPLSDALAQIDHTVDAYVGALSEDFNAIRIWGFMAFGGAGAYLSTPLAMKVAGQALKCLNEASGGEGDIILRDCVYRNSKAKLTILPGLYQQDLRDDASGFFEAGLRAINFHHWKSWYKEPVVKMATAASLCGDCFLQRWRFGADTVFSNGFSIAQYPYGTGDLDLGLMEGTWTNANADFDFSIGPLREKLMPSSKKSYKFVDVIAKDGEPLRQLYVSRGDRDALEMDEIIELVWEE